MAQDIASLFKASVGDTEQSGLDGLELLGNGYTPLSDDEGRFGTWLSQLHPLTSDELDKRISQAQSAASDLPAGGAAGGSASSAADGAATAGGGRPSCLQYKDAVLDRIERALRASLSWVVQQGAVDFGFLGDDVPDCSPNCAFTNPNSPYGLTLLPEPPFEAQRRSVGARPRQDRGVTPPSLANASASLVPGLAPIYQLLRQEVVLVAGCTPPERASAYFGVTPYVHTVWNEESRKWVTVFGSMGDTASTISLAHRPTPPPPTAEVANASNAAALPLPLPPGTEPPAAVVVPRSRLASFPLRPSGSSMLQAAAASLGTFPTTRLGQRWMQRLTGGAGAMGQAAEPDAVSGAGAAAAAAAATAAASTGSSTAREFKPTPNAAFDEFFVAVMTASPAAAAAVTKVLQPVLESFAAGGAGGGPRINVLPIPGPEFSAGLGIDPRSSYYMMLLRSIVPAGALGPYFRPYAEAKPLRGWRLTPVLDLTALPEGTLAEAAAADGNGTAVTNSAGAAGGAVASGGGLFGMGMLQGVLGRPVVVGNLTDGAVVSPDLPLVALKDDRFGLPSVIPRRAAATGPLAATPAANGSNATAAAGGGRAALAGARRQAPAETWLEPAFQFLLQRVQEAHEQDFAQAWSLTTGDPLGALDPPIDWGLQCLQQMIDYCNGDNRDATYLSSFPYVTLNRPNSSALIVGANHAMTGTATYINIALSDPAFDSSEMAGSALPYLTSTPYELYAPYLYVVKYARNCGGQPYCKDVPTDGPRSAPLGRNLVATLRAYTSPATGVGPHADDLLKFMTVNLVNRGEARLGDVRARPTDPWLFARDGCASALLGQVLCAQGPDESCCRQVQKWTDTGCCRVLRVGPVNVTTPAGRSVSLGGGAAGGGSCVVGCNACLLTAFRTRLLRALNLAPEYLDTPTCQQPARSSGSLGLGRRQLQAAAKSCGEPSSEIFLPLRLPDGADAALYAYRLVDALNAWAEESDAAAAAAGSAAAAAAESSLQFCVPPYSDIAALLLPAAPVVDTTTSPQPSGGTVAGAAVVSGGGSGGGVKTLAAAAGAGFVGVAIGVAITALILVKRKRARQAAELAAESSTDTQSLDGQEGEDSESESRASRRPSEPHSAATSRQPSLSISNRSHSDLSIGGRRGSRPATATATARSAHHFDLESPRDGKRRSLSRPASAMVEPPPPPLAAEAAEWAPPTADSFVSNTVTMLMAPREHSTAASVRSALSALLPTFGGLLSRHGSVTGPGGPGRKRRLLMPGAIDAASICSSRRSTAVNSPITSGGGGAPTPAPAAPPFLGIQLTLTPPEPSAAPPSARGPAGWHAPAPLVLTLPPASPKGGVLTDAQVQFASPTSGTPEPAPAPPPVDPITPIAPPPPLTPRGEPAGTSDFVLRLPPPQLAPIGGVSGRSLFAAATKPREAVVIHHGSDSESDAPPAATAITTIAELPAALPKKAEAPKVQTLQVKSQDKKGKGKHRQGLEAGGPGSSSFKPSALPESAVLVLPNTEPEEEAKKKAAADMWTRGMSRFGRMARAALEPKEPNPLLPPPKPAKRFLDTIKQNLWTLDEAPPGGAATSEPTAAAAPAADAGPAPPTHGTWVFPSAAASSGRDAAEPAGGDVVTGGAWAFKRRSPVHPERLAEAVRARPEPEPAAPLERPVRVVRSNSFGGARGEDMTGGGAGGGEEGGVRRVPPRRRSSGGGLVEGAGGRPVPSGVGAKQRSLRRSSGGGAASARPPWRGGGARFHSWKRVM
ncbi:hypothetical protein GPECTOR_38g337 [Gonium pectorale]|uniref:Uncharacterized protein n=1 Tax=Gonium pectorale TaxID=33097 RepID=A0A150GCP3_GONPE|nr:hypothetical protein GPECTOR_38g337 [Gonium pectorale]|eukprot:KXZ47100.1 hypothetical protein GPECTOR_38g337 [Gonium pectorale]